MKTLKDISRKQALTAALDLLKTMAMNDFTDKDWHIVKHNLRSSASVIWQLEQALQTYNQP